VSACGSTIPPLASSVEMSLLPLPAHPHPLSAPPPASVQIAPAPCPNTSSGSAAEPYAGTLPASPGSNLSPHCGAADPSLLPRDTASRVSSSAGNSTPVSLPHRSTEAPCSSPAPRPLRAEVPPCSSLSSSTGPPLAVSVEQKVLARVGQRYADFGPALAAEHLAKDGFALSRETLRTWMTKAAFWHPRCQRVKKIHVWRERRASFGELVMQDSSPLRWLENRGPACQLIAVIDDATSRIWGRFTEHDTTEENLRTFGGWVRRYGRPLAHYTDKNSIFRKAGPQPLPEQLRGEPLRKKFGRALNELGIEWIAAHSPQAKGRIERLFETLQDRLVKEMRLAGIDSIQGANHFLEMRFLPEWEQRFTVAARNPRNAHRRLGREQHLEEILSVRVARRVAQDHTVSWDGNRWGVLREEVCAGLRGAAVEIERRLD